MDFDLKIYIPLLAACVTSTAALIVGIINWRTNIKIKNRDILINNLETDISKLIQVKKVFVELYCALLLSDLDDNFLDDKILFDKLAPLLSSCFIEFGTISFLIEESSFIKEYEAVLDNVNSSDVDSLVQRFTKGDFNCLIELFDKEIKLKRDEIKNILL